MILTHLVMFKLFKGASNLPAGAGFKGYTTVPPFSFLRKLSDSSIPPVVQNTSMYPLHRRRRGR